MNDAEPLLGNVLVARPLAIRHRATRIADRRLEPCIHQCGRAFHPFPCATKEHPRITSAIAQRPHPCGSSVFDPGGRKPRSHRPASGVDPGNRDPQNVFSTPPLFCLHRDSRPTCLFRFSPRIHQFVLESYISVFVSLL